jgi:hypothetical protein
MSERPVPKIVVNVDFFSDIHRISCQVEVGSTGLIGMMNDVNSSLVTVRNAYVSRLQQPAKIIANFEEAHLAKAALALGMVNRREDLGPQAYIRGGYSKVLSAPAMFAMTAFEVRATVEFPARFDPDAILVGGSGKYTVAFNATIHAMLYPDTPFTAPAILLNRTLVTSIGAVAKGKT